MKCMLINPLPLNSKRSSTAPQDHCEETRVPGPGNLRGGGGEAGVRAYPRQPRRRLLKVSVLRFLTTGRKALFERFALYL